MGPAVADIAHGSEYGYGVDKGGPGDRQAHQGVTTNVVENYTNVVEN
jgi:hypothetical protein